MIWIFRANYNQSLEYIIFITWFLAINYLQSEGRLAHSA